MNARQEWLLAQWDAACQDPDLAQLPHKVEINEWGKVELSPPAPPFHNDFAFELAKLLEATLGGKASVEIAILTELGVRVPDVVWVPMERRGDFRSTSPLTVAPEICVEVLSPSNTSEELAAKTRAYLGAGACEVVLVDPASRRVRFFDGGGERSESRYGLVPARMFE